jgi:putative intracellular protease/amidase
LVLRHEDGFAVGAVEEGWAEDGDAVFVGGGGDGGDVFFAEELAEFVEEFCAAVGKVGF